MTVADDLKDAQVLTPEGETRRLGDAWRDRPVVLAFVRHFGWLFCREYVTQLRGALDRIRALGAELVVIGNGQPFYAEAFRKEFQLDFPLFVDPGLEVYGKAGLKRGLLRTISLGSAARSLATRLRGHRTTGIQGDPLQQGGVFVILPSDQVPYAYLSQEAGDHPPVADVVAALERAVK